MFIIYMHFYIGMLLSLGTNYSKVHIQNCTRLIIVWMHTFELILGMGKATPIHYVTYLHKKT